jgi:hypothetical protein
MRPEHRLWALVTVIEASLLVHASMKLPWGLAGLGTIIKRGTPHTLPLWFAVSGLAGLFSYGVKASRQSRFSDPEATIEIGFWAVSFASFIGPRFRPPPRLPSSPPHPRGPTAWPVPPLLPSFPTSCPSPMWSMADSLLRSFVHTNH